jgi:hypothetical protein
LTQFINGLKSRFFVVSWLESIGEINIYPIDRKIVTKSSELFFYVTQYYLRTLGDRNRRIHAHLWANIVVCRCRKLQRVAGVFRELPEPPAKSQKFCRNSKKGVEHWITKKFFKK